MNSMLLKNIMKENPDDGFDNVDSDELKRVKALGYDVQFFSNPYGKDIVAFTIDSRSGHLAYMLNNEEQEISAYHYHIEEVISDFKNGKDDPSAITEGIVGPNERGDYGICYQRITPDKDVVWFLNVHSKDKLEKAVLEFNTTDSYRSARGPMVSGRIWEKRRFIAFWTNRAISMSVIDMVFDLLKKFKLEPEKCLYEFIDKQRLYTFKELELPDTSKPKSSAEIMDLMKKQHLDPAAKAKLASIQGVHQKNSPGFDFQAQRNAMMPAIAESLLLKDILKEDQPSDFESKFIIPIEESPDGVRVKPGVAATLKSKGIDVEKIKATYYDDNDSVSFMYDINHRQMLFHAGTEKVPSVTHPEIGLQIVHYWANPKDFKFEDSQGKLGARFEPIISKKFNRSPVDAAEDSVHALYINKAVDFRKYLQKIDIPLDGDVPRNDKKFLLGRFWRKGEVISFWREKDQVLPYMKGVVDLLKACDLDPLKVVYEFLDNDHLFSYDELNTEHGQVRSDSEQKELMAKQHLDPEAKKRLAAIQKIIYQKAPSGFEDLPARRDASMPALQEIVRKIIKENPDGFMDIDGKGEGWNASDSRTFLTFPDFSLAAKYSGVTHAEIMIVLRKCRMHGDMDLLNKFSIESSDENATQVSLETGILSEYFDEYDSERPISQDTTSTRSNSDDYDSSRQLIGPYRDLPDSLSGRLWIDDRVISFWNKESKVLKLWPQVQEMFSHFGYMFESLEDYRVDWLEREGDNSIEMTPASSIGKEEEPHVTDYPEEEKNGQLNFIARMFRDPNKLKSLSTDQLKKVREKMHVLAPEAKNQLMKMSGQFKNKAAEIAQILGVSVAEFHHLTHVAESNSI